MRGLPRSILRSMFWLVAGGRLLAAGCEFGRPLLPATSPGLFAPLGMLGVLLARGLYPVFAGLSLARPLYPVFTGLPSTRPLLPLFPGPLPARPLLTLVIRLARSLFTWTLL